MKKTPSNLFLPNLKDRFMITWVAQSVNCQTLDFGAGHGLRVMRSSPTLGSVQSVEMAYDSLSPSPACPSPGCMCVCVHSLQNKNKFKIDSATFSLIYWYMFCENFCLRFCSRFVFGLARNIIRVRITKSIECRNMISLSLKTPLKLYRA